MTVDRLGGMSFGWAPKSLKYLVLFTCGMSLFAGLFDNVFTRLMGVMGPQQLLSLSWAAVAKAYFWQPVTYLFVHHGQGGLSLFFLMELFFHMYILWTMGAAVISHVGEWPFLRMYFFSGIGAGLIALLSMFGLGQNALIVGAGPAILAVVTVWALLFPEQELLLFFSIAAKGKWIAVGLIGISLVIDLSHFAFVHMATTLGGVCLGYLYAITAWEVHSPFDWTRPVDRIFSDWGYRWRHRRDNQLSVAHTLYQKAKVFDFRTGEAVVDDEAFMDAMLAKISQYGEDSLSRKELARMRKISERQN